ncbi:protein of unknown function [Bartonella clarridgeiae 73]|uniref:Uncharacterized protein n=1 Tax=Bartonella clarridgeiae (strain CCUG 45776 / CIP 104772 / 73) TaxID=696125 RepID=E6YGF3_BARC7|nr:protein of unknown function [Bartonella clarridgeiae 73]
MIKNFLIICVIRTTICTEAVIKRLNLVINCLLSSVIKSRGVLENLRFISIRNRFRTKSY